MTTIEKLASVGIQANPTMTGNQYTVCPACSGDRKKKRLKCLSVDIGKGVWNCHHCGWAGNVATIGKGIVTKDDHREPMPSLADMLNIDSKMLTWFFKRGITGHTLERNQIGSTHTYMPNRSGNVLAICFNYFHGGELVKIKYRDAQKNFRQTKGGMRTFYGIDDIKEQETVIICEGEMDKLSFNEAGMWNAVSVDNGAPSPTSKNFDSYFVFLDNCHEQLKHVKRFYIATDMDAPGHTLREELARRIGRHKCWMVDFPVGQKDANDVLNHLGADMLKVCIETAKPYPINDVLEVRDFDEEIDQLYNGKIDRGVGIGHTEYDEHVRLKTGLLEIITGIPSSGKSNFKEYVSIRMAAQHGWKFAWFSPEQYPMSVMFARLAEIFVGNPFHEGPHPRMTKEQLQEAKGFIGEHFYFIRPEDEAFTLDKILEIGEAMVFRYGIKNLLIDPWNTIAHDMGKDTETKYIEQALNKIRTFIQRHDVLVTVVAHPNKVMKRDDGTFEIPNLYSISGSANWFNKADIGMTVYRVHDSDEVDVYVQKIKHKHLGKLGRCKFQYNMPNSRYYDAGGPPDNRMYVPGKLIGTTALNNNGVMPIEASSNHNEAPIAEADYPPNWDI